MSDLNYVKQKTKEGVEWRGTIRVTIGGEEKELTIRQLVDPEFEEVMRLIDRDELQQLREELPTDLMEEHRELQRKEEELTDEEQERFTELEEKLEENTVDLFEILSEDTFKGIRLCGKYAVEPDEEDKREAFMERAAEIEREYDTRVETPEDVEPALQDDIEFMIENATNFTSFTIGVQALVETVGRDEGNSES
jgi:hypothetical protein